MFDLVVDLWRSIFESRDEARLNNAAFHGYEAAWRSRERTGDSSAELLLTAISQQGSGEVLQPPYAADVQAALASWDAGMSPEEARAGIRAASD
jgi:hypothetical protein